MALLIVSKESELTETGNSALTPSVFPRLGRNVGSCACILHVTRHSTLTQLQINLELAAQVENCDRKWRIVIVSAEFGSKQRHEIGPRPSTRSTGKIYFKSLTYFPLKFKNITLQHLEH